MTAHRRNPQAGVTLLEIMVVLAIMALIIGLAAPRLLDTFGRAKSRAAVLQMENIRGALQLYYIDVGRFPSEAEGLSALIAAPSGVDRWLGPYVNEESDLTDPWGRVFLYRSPGQEREFDIFTLGRDGQSGGTREDSDIYR